MGYFKCGHCDNALFEQVQPCVFDENGVRVFSAGNLIPVEHTSITVLRCLKCGVISLPSCSLVGKNYLDIDVKIYRELYDLINEYNKELVGSKITNTANINALNAETDKLKLDLELIYFKINEITALKEEVVEVPKEEPKKNVKTGRPSKKNT